MKWKISQHNIDVDGNDSEMPGPCDGITHARCERCRSPGYIYYCAVDFPQYALIQSELRVKLRWNYDEKVYRKNLISLNGIEPTAMAGEIVSFTHTKRYDFTRCNNTVYVEAYIFRGCSSASRWRFFYEAHSVSSVLNASVNIIIIMNDVVTSNIQLRIIRFSSLVQFSRRDDKLFLSHNFRVRTPKNEIRFLSSSMWNKYNGRWIQEKMWRSFWLFFVRKRKREDGTCLTILFLILILQLNFWSISVSLRHLLIPAVQIYFCCDINSAVF